MRKHAREAPGGDHVDLVLAEWRKEQPRLDTSPIALYRSLMRTSGGMTHLVDRLEQEGLVERIADPDDRRRLLVALTRKGRALITRVGPSHLETERRMLAALTKQEQAELARLLRKLLIGLEQQFPGLPPQPLAEHGRRRRQPRPRRGRKISQTEATLGRTK